MERTQCEILIITQLTTPQNFSTHEADGYSLHSESSDENLPTTTNINIGAKITILWNINRSLGLINGATEALNKIELAN